jgi:hypothetical protein
VDTLFSSTIEANAYLDLQSVDPNQNFTLSYEESMAGKTSEAVWTIVLKGEHP